jgi:hypothetical protein
VIIPQHLTATEDKKISSSEADLTAAASLKQVFSENTEEKFSSFEEVTESSPQTGMSKIFCTNN